MIKIPDCKDGYLYKIMARNGDFGVYNKKDISFTLARYKFGETYLFDEYHYDFSKTFGTVIPIKELKKCELQGENLLDFLKTLPENYNGE